jgi:[acyl-carrier-protein] S-malonyltransferase|tara:strand:- start:1843 stop:2772 length:930 start_codon:yes stop_codon:yes gene_type:complete
MFAVMFPGQGSQAIGMAKEFYDRYSFVKNIFKKADEVLEFPISKLILEGPSDQLNITENTQPSIFLVSYSIFSVVKSEFNIDLNKAKYFAGHSLGEYSALTAANSIDFENAIRLLKKRGRSMQLAVPFGKGAMIAILGQEIKDIEKILLNIGVENCQIANDNCPGQIVVSGTLSEINKLIDTLKKLSIKNIKLPVSAPFHCKLMKTSTEIMKKEINNTKFNTPSPKIISNVNALEQDNIDTIKNLLIEQIESTVKWRESVQYMIKNGVKKFIEIGPGKVLTGLVKRIDKNVESYSINNDEDIKKININD